MVDLGTEVSDGMWGLRLGVGMDAAGTALAPLVPAEGSSGAWSSDMDLGLNLARVARARALFGRTEPSLFVGAGGAGVATTDPESGERSSTFVPTWSLGARGGYAVTRRLGLEVEARRRETIGEVPSEEYPVREGWEYRIGMALRLGGATASGVIAPPPAVPLASAATTPASTAAAPAVAEIVAASEAIAAATVETAGRFIGTRYRWGGASPADGFDCSGFVQYVFRQQGIELPRVSRDQARAGTELPTDLTGLEPGDLLFFAQSGPSIDHVAIYAGDGRIVHSSRSGYGVRYDELTGGRGRWYARHLVAVRRIIDGTAYAGVLAAGDDAGAASSSDETLGAESADGAPPPEGGR